MLTFVILAYVVAERLLELYIARRNTHALLARGGREVGASHYPMMMALHMSWLVSVAIWALALTPPVDAALLVVYALLQVMRFWVMTSLGSYWTTRIITVPDAPLVRRGPYRFLKHPNYVVVTLEIAVLPLVFGAWYLAAVYTVLNAAMLWVRIRTENAALKERP